MKYKTKIKTMQSRRHYVAVNPYYTRDGCTAYSIRCEIVDAEDDMETSSLWMREAGTGHEFIQTTGCGGKGAKRWESHNNNESF